MKNKSIYFKFYSAILVIINMAFLSCNSSEIKKENENLKSQLEDKENFIRQQIVEVERTKSENELAKAEIRNLNNKNQNDFDKPLNELYNKVKSSVYLIYTKNNEGISQGSAFVLTDDGLAISNLHVFANASSAIAINENGDQFLISEIIEENPSKDYIIFKLGPLSKPIPCVSIAQKKSNIGEPVFAVGNPKGLTQTLSEGIVSSYRDNFIQTTTEITNGSSGGPLFNKHGQVIGITSSGMGEANLNFAIDIHSTSISKYMKDDTNISISNKLNEQDLISLMNRYYYALINEDINALTQMYAYQISRYHSLFSISKNVAINDHIEYLKNYHIKSIEILPNSFLMYTGNTGYTIQYKIDYRIRKKSNNRELNYILNTVSVIDNNMKIESIYDNILKRN